MSSCVPELHFESILQFLYARINGLDYLGSLYGTDIYVKLSTGATKMRCRMYGTCKNGYLPSLFQYDG